MGRRTERRRASACLGVLMLAAGLALCAMPRAAFAAAHVPAGFTDAQVVTAVQVPVGLAFLPDGRLLFAELRTGQVRMIVAGGLGSIDPVVVVDSVETLGGERGLTGVAVDPAWPVRPYVYVSYSALGSKIRISRFTASGDLSDSSSSTLLIDPASRFDVMRDIPDDLVSHNGGTIRFGPDGMLYAGLGDDQQGCTAQDTVSLRGVMLRLDVSGLPAGPGTVLDKSVLVPIDNPWANHPDPNARLVWATGLRNPFRFHIDPANGNVFIADVGTRLWEEISMASAAGENFGWPMFEGPFPTGIQCDPPVTTNFNAPIYAYDQATLPARNASAVSAGVYRLPDCDDCGFPAEYEGNYFFVDFFAGFLRRLVDVGGTWQLAPPVPGQPTVIDWGHGFHRATDFAVAPNGDLYYTRSTVDTLGWTGAGDVRRIIYLNQLVSLPTQAGHDARFTVRPSPTRGPVRFSFNLERASRVGLDVFDLAGRRVSEVVDTQTFAAGEQHWSWDGRGRHGRSVGPGVYLARLQVDGRLRTRRFAVIR